MTHIPGLPDWNDLPNEARSAACKAPAWFGVAEWERGQCALEVYEAIREHVPPAIFPLFQRREKPRVRVQARGVPHREPSHDD